MKMAAYLISTKAKAWIINHRERVDIEFNVVVVYKSGLGAIH